MSINPWIKRDSNRDSGGSVTAPNKTDATSCLCLFQNWNILWYMLVTFLASFCEMWTESLIFDAFSIWMSPWRLQPWEKQSFSYPSFYLSVYNVTYWAWSDGIEWIYLYSSGFPRPRSFPGTGRLTPFLRFFLLNGALRCNLNILIILWFAHRKPLVGLRSQIELKKRPVLVSKTRENSRWLSRTWVSCHMSQEPLMGVTFGYSCRCIPVFHVNV